jgi:hypothetical protein
MAKHLVKAHSGVLYGDVIGAAGGQGTQWSAISLFVIFVQLTLSIARQLRATRIASDYTSKSRRCLDWPCRGRRRFTVVLSQEREEYGGVEGREQNDGDGDHAIHQPPTSTPFSRCHVTLTFRQR